MRLRDIENAGNRTLSALFANIEPVWDAFIPWVAIVVLTAIPVMAFVLILSMMTGRSIG